MQGSTNLSLGPEHDPMYTKSTKVTRNFIETAILEHKTKLGARSTPRVHEVDESRPKRSFWSGFCAGGTKRSLGPDHAHVHEMDESDTKRNGQSGWVLVQGGTKLSLGLARSRPWKHDMDENLTKQY